MSPLYQNNKQLEERVSDRIYQPSQKEIAEYSRRGALRMIGKGICYSAGAVALAGLLACGKGGGGGAPTGSTGGLSGKIDDLTAANDIIDFNQNSLNGSSYRRLGIITRWELPVAVFGNQPVDADRVRVAMDYWASRTPIRYTIININTGDRILFREGTDGLADGTNGRGLIDGVYSNNRARSGLVVVRPGATSDYLYRHELGHALGFLGHSDSGLMAGGSELTQREINMMNELYKLPYGAQVQRDGTWKVVL